MPANVLAAITPSFEIQRCHHHEARIGIGVEVRTLFNGIVVCTFSGGGHAFIVACLVLKNTVQRCAT